VANNGYFSYTLNCFGLSNNNYRGTTTEDLKLDSKIWPKGSRVYYIFCLADDIGFIIQGQESFTEAVYTFVCYSICYLELWPGLGDKHSEFKKVIKETLKKIKDLAKQDMPIVG